MEPTRTPGALQRTRTLKVVDLDPREKLELLDVLDYALENEAYIRVEVRKVEPMPVTIVKANL